MIERTFDYRIVNRFASWKVRISSDYFYLIEKSFNEVLGLWSLEPHKDGLRIHADMGPKCRGKNAIESAKRAFKWVFENTEFKNIYAGIPKENRPACRVASFAGMRFTGNDKKLRLFHLQTG